MVGEIEESHSRALETKTVPLAIGLHDLSLGYPVALAPKGVRIDREMTHHVFPHGQRPVFVWRETFAVSIAQCPIEILGLDVVGADLSSVGQSYGGRQPGVVGDLPDRTDRVFEGEISQHL